MIFGCSGNIGGFGWIGMILNLVITFGAIISLVFLVVWAVKRTSSSSTGSEPQNMRNQTAQEIAQSRYAQGEINREQYQQILSDLGH
ncbi:MAG: SHOCT domain-containing protein [Chloroflexota bacterium]